MRRCILKPQFDRDIRRLKRRGKDVEKLIHTVDLLEQGIPLSPSFRLHRLSGVYDGVWECHIENDWLLMYTTINQQIILLRTGSHADLFK